MGTKNNPGKYDAYNKAKDDEPLFTLLARDRFAPMLIEMWAQWEENRVGADNEKVKEAKECAMEMRKWYSQHTPSPDPV